MHVSQPFAHNHLACAGAITPRGAVVQLQVMASPSADLPCADSSTSTSTPGVTRLLASPAQCPNSMSMVLGLAPTATLPAQPSSVQNVQVRRALCCLSSQRARCQSSRTAPDCVRCLHVQYIVSGCGSQPPAVDAAQPWRENPMLLAALAYSASAAAVAAVALSAALLWAVRRWWQRKLAALQVLLQQLQNLGSVQLPDGNFLVHVGASSSAPRPCRANGGPVAEGQSENGSLNTPHAEPAQAVQEPTAASTPQPPLPSSSASRGAGPRGDGGGPSLTGAGSGQAPDQVEHAPPLSNASASEAQEPGRPSARHDLAGERVPFTAP